MEAPQLIRKKKRRRAPRPKDEEFGGSGRSRKRRRGSRKRAKLIVVLTCIWVALLGGAAGLIVYLTDKPTTKLTATDDVPKRSDEDNDLLRDHGQQIIKSFHDFLSDTNISTRSSHVLRAPVTVTHMARQQSMATELAYYGDLKVIDRNVIQTPIGKGIEAMFHLNTDQQVEGVFFEEDGEWKLDWDAYAHFSPDAWPIFLAGGGEDHGEFRLFARQRANGALLPPEKMGIVLSLPRFGRPAEILNSSPAIVVDRDSDIGRELQDAFDLRQKGLGQFGSTMVTHDAPDQIRVRVKVSRVDGEEKSFHIDELIACHWLELGGKADDEKSKP